MIHIAGIHVTVDGHLRQRCAWCGTTLIDWALDQIAVPEGQDPMPGTWEAGGLIEVAGPATWQVPHPDGDTLPDTTCARLDPEVTR
jgi:hypothetical protein